MPLLPLPSTPPTPAPAALCSRVTAPTVPSQVVAGTLVIRKTTARSQLASTTRSLWRRRGQLFFSVTVAAPTLVLAEISTPAPEARRTLSTSPRTRAMPGLGLVQPAPFSNPRRPSPTPVYVTAGRARTSVFAAVRLRE